MISTAVLDKLCGITHRARRRPDPETFVPTVPVVQSLRSVQAARTARTGTLFKITRDRSCYCAGFSTTVLSRLGIARKHVRKGDANLILTFSTNAKPPMPLRYFFCANSLAASAAREKSKIDPAATSPFKLAVELSIAM